MPVDADPVKDDVQRAVPIAWRSVLWEIVEAIRRGDARLASDIAGVGEVDADTAAHISDYVADYGEALVALPEQTWETSVAYWFDPYWQVLVDLWTEPMQRSDLVLDVKIYEAGDDYRFEVYLVYVP